MKHRADSIKRFLSRHRLLALSGLALLLTGLTQAVVLHRVSPLLGPVLLGFYGVSARLHSIDW